MRPPSSGDTGIRLNRLPRCQIVTHLMHEDQADKSCRILPAKDRGIDRHRQQHGGRGNQGLEQHAAFEQGKERAHALQQLGGVDILTFLVLDVAGVVEVGDDEPVMTGNFAAMDLIFYGIAIYEGYKFGSR
jgi:hypothetical protein